MRAKPDGFELTFTKPVDPKTAADPASYSVKTYTYIYQADYGSPEVDRTSRRSRRSTAAVDGKSARVHLDPLTKGHIHEFKLAGVKDAHGQPLVHDSPITR